MRLKFHAIADNRRFVTLDAVFDDGGGIDMTQFAFPLGVKDAVVRVRYTVTAEQSRRIEQSRLRANLIAAGALKVIFKPTIIREDRARVATMGEDLSETDALELWIASQAVENPEPLRKAHATYVEELA